MYLQISIVLEVFRCVFCCVIVVVAVVVVVVVVVVLRCSLIDFLQCCMKIQVAMFDRNLICCQIYNFILLQEFVGYFWKTFGDVLNGFHTMLEDLGRFLDYFC